VIWSWGGRCVEFKDYETVFEGGRIEAVNLLISLGADPAGISLEIQVKDDSSVIQTRDYGTSVVADDGIARTGVWGYARAGVRGIAWPARLAMPKLETLA
jgi:hypothetical protein